ncbi:MAG TPA: hypothetical protein VNO86_05040 [Candidatus Binatia bacterium]|nr:hypothetical protein [Candidatus Binatia bacterium]
MPRAAGAPRLAPPPDRVVRDATIRRLAAEGWSTREIGREVGLTSARVSQLLRSMRTLSSDEIAALAAEVAAELRTLLEVREAASARIVALRSALRRLEEERETRRIDEILGLVLTR